MSPIPLAAPFLLFLGGIGDLTRSFAELGDRAAQYGYAAVVLVVAGDGIFPLFPGETAVVAAAVLASQGTLNLYLVILAGAVGAMLGDSTAYFIGRVGQDTIRGWLIKMAGGDRVDIAEGMVERHGPALVFVGRFIPGLRIAINMSCGAGLMEYRRFLLFNSLGAFFWSTQAALLGFFAGRAFADQIWVAFAVAIGLTLAVGAFVALKERQHVRRERAERAAAAGSAGPPA
ncbi:MAG: DedA family protein [Thermoleophilia bacterium]|nr:DedA family protein [Thermoleophilia bacterium]